MPIEKESKKFITDSPKTNFFFGLILGVAIVAILGFGGILLTRDNPTDNLGDENGDVAGAEEEVVVDLQINENDLVLGNPDAPVKVFEFSDFQCPYCAMFHEVMHQIVDEYDGQVVWVYKQFPIASHPLGMPGAIATECANEQGKFWEMSDMIFANQDTLTEASFEEYAEELGLNLEAYQSCVADERYYEKILTDYNLGVENGVRGTPTNFVNNEMVPGAVPYENMKAIIDELLQ